VIGAQGEQLGILPIEVALSRAGEDGLDLVEVSPMSKPPVCKIMDYGKFKYETKKKASEAKKKQVVVHLKEVKFRPKTEEHDYDFKVKNIRRFLEEGDKARVTIMFRGREITHKDIGQKILEKVTQDLKDIAIVETTPRMEGRQMFMILTVNPKWKPPKPPKPVAAPKPSPVGDGTATPAPAAPDSMSPPTVAVSIGTPPLAGPQPTPEKMKSPDALVASKA
jgi:translation initiation factor IF-3